MELLIVILKILGISAVCYLFIHIYFKKDDEIKRLKRRTDYFDTNYLSKQGATSVYQNKEAYKGENMLNYDLRSWDGGKNWYAIDVDLPFEQNQIKILGTAEEVYPKLLEHLEAWDDLNAWIKINGAVDGTNEIGLRKLKNAGFTVSIK
jgi:hypothetical protein